jgi:tight adherence protein B
MNTEMLLAIAAATLAALTVVVVMVGIRSLTRRDVQVGDRMSTYLGGQAVVPVDVEDQQLAEKLNERIKQLSFAQRIERELQQVNLPLTVTEYLLVRIAVPLTLTVVGIVIWRNVLTVPLTLLIGFVLPIFWMNWLRSRRNLQFQEQMPETLDLLTAAMRGGLSMVQSLASVASDSQEPTRTELRRVFQEVQLGLSITKAMDNLAQRMESSDLDLVVTAIKIHSRVGGNLTNILEGISTTIRERTKLRREVRVITSMQRISSYVIGGMPFALAGILFVINPAYMSRLFTPGWTLCIPIGAVISSVIGFLVIQKIADVKI